jgi:hypothetical protein
MNEHDVDALERRLRGLPPLLSVPPDLVERAQREGFADPATPRHTRSRRHRLRGWSLRWRFAGVAVAATAAIAIALVLSSSPSHTGFRRIAMLAGTGGASGYVAVGPAEGAVEPVTVSISHLPPAPTRSYYQVWFQTGAQQVPGVAFNSDAGGAADIRFTAPTNTRWVRCWVARQSLDDPGTQTIVMRAKDAPRPAWRRGKHAWSLADRHELHNARARRGTWYRAAVPGTSRGLATLPTLNEDVDER